MPGIVGLITKMGRERAEPQLRRMVEAMRHESFYETDTWVDEAAGVYIGWIVRHGSSPGKFPIQRDGGQKRLFFAGEDFSEHTIRIDGAASQAPDAGGGYLAQIAESDTSFPSGLNGRFHGLLHDQQSGVTTLFVDRYGMQRLYYHESNDALYFAAEAKAILAVRPELRAIDSRGLGELISCGCVLENRSIFKGIGVLPPGSLWKFNRGRLESKSLYFEPKEWEDQGELDPESYYKQLQEIFSRNIPKYFSGQQRIGVSLTGGLDSRMIMAWLRAPSGSVPCFSFGGPIRDCGDVLVAQKVAQACGQSHQTIRVDDNFVTKFPYYSERSIFLTDACVDVGRSCDLYVNEIAREIAPVRMTGNYGGEVLRSIRAFKPVEPAGGLFHPDVAHYLGQARQTYSGLVSVHPLSFSVFRQAPWHHYGLLALEQTQLALRSPFLDNDLVRTVFRAPKDSLNNNDASLRLIQNGNPSLSKIRTDRGLAGESGRLLSALHREYLEFTFKAEYAYDHGMPQWVARADHALSALHLERLFLGRHKFYHFRIWYRDALASFVREMLLDSRTLARPYLQRRSVEKIVAGHIKGDHNYTIAIHKILTLEYLHRLFIDA